MLFVLCLYLTNFAVYWTAKRETFFLNLCSTQSNYFDPKAETHLRRYHFTIQQRGTPIYVKSLLLFLITISAYCEILCHIRYRNNIRMDLGEWECVNWMRLGLDRDQRRDAVKLVNEP